MKENIKTRSLGLTLLEVSIALIVAALITIGLIGLINSNYIIMRANNISGLMQQTDIAVQQYLINKPINFNGNANEEIAIQDIIDQGLLGKQGMGKFYNALKIYIRPIQQGKNTYYNGIEYIIIFDPQIWSPNNSDFNKVMQGDIIVSIGNKGGVYHDDTKEVTGIAAAWKAKLSDFYSGANSETDDEKNRKIYIRGILDVRPRISEITTLSCFDAILGNNCAALPIEFNCDSKGGSSTKYNNELLVFTYTGHDIESARLGDKNNLISEQLIDNKLIYNFRLSTFCPSTNPGDTVTFIPVITPVNSVGIAGQPYEYSSAIKLTRVK